MPTEKAQGGDPGGRPAGRGRRPQTWWMISREDARGGPEPLTLGRPEGRALALFGFADEAELYLRIGGLQGGGWRVRASGCGEVASVLFGPCADVRRVVLDPLPGMAVDGTLGLACVEKKRFLARFLGAGVPDRGRPDLRPTGQRGNRT